MTRFAERFNSDNGIAAALPERSERHGRKSNVVKGTYEIAVDKHNSLFAGSIIALATAVDDHIVSNHFLIGRINEIYQETLAEVLEFDSEGVIVIVRIALF